MCPPPAAKTAFLTTDNAAWFDFAYTGGTAGDMFQVQWYEPNGTLDVTNTYTQGTTGGSSCYSYELAIAGATPASLTGTWTVKLIWNGTPNLFDTVHHQHSDVRRRLAPASARPAAPSRSKLLPVNFPLRRPFRSPRLRDPFRTPRHVTYPTSGPQNWITLSSTSGTADSEQSRQRDDFRK